MFLAGEVRRRKKRDIQISRKLHARGISLIVGSSSSSEGKDEFGPVDLFTFFGTQRLRPYYD